MLFRRQSLSDGWFVSYRLCTTDWLITLQKCHKGITNNDTTIRKRRCALLDQKWNRGSDYSRFDASLQRSFRRYAKCWTFFLLPILLDNGNDSVLECQPKKSAVYVYCRQSKEINYRCNKYLPVSKEYRKQNILNVTINSAEISIFKVP